MPDTIRKNENKSLWLIVLDVTSRAREQRALHPIATTYEYIGDNGFDFFVRIIANLDRKHEDKNRKKQRYVEKKESFNPFLPLDKELFVANLTGSHAAVLNKFNVVDHHLLIVTREFEDQDRLLTMDDFRAMDVCLSEYDGLAFYNGGTVAGASQRHKHLQYVPLPLFPDRIENSFEALFQKPMAHAESACLAEVPFLHAFKRLDWDFSGQPEEKSAYLRACYRECMEKSGMRWDSSPEAVQSGPYNLLFTRTWMLLVPRKCEFFTTMSLNSLAFAGAFLVRNNDELNEIKQSGPLAALNHVTFPLS